MLSEYSSRSNIKLVLLVVIDYPYNTQLWFVYSESRSILI